MSFAGLDAWLRSRSDADLFSGVVLIRRGDATLFTGAFGWASRRCAVPVALATRFDTASITKLFTAVAALQLVDQGRLDLDLPIVEVVDLLSGSSAGAGRVPRLMRSAGACCEQSRGHQDGGQRPDPAPPAGSEATIHQNSPETAA